MALNFHEADVKVINSVASFTRRVYRLFHSATVKIGNLIPTLVKPDLIILDDLFPHVISAFRIAEYTALLRDFPKAIAWTTGASLPYIKETRPLPSIIADYETQHPDLRGRVQYLHPYKQLRGQLAYVMFLHNAYAFIEQLEASQIPFVLQLYPGGTFRLYDTESDQKLARVCQSIYMRHIIVTQTVSYNYLLERGFCQSKQLTLIFGVVAPLDLLTTAAIKRLYYPDTKSTRDICFVAAKYMPAGLDKGYDLFIETARQLVTEFDNLHFHVVGPYDETDFPVAGLENRLHFYGTQPTDFFSDFYARMDAIISPNRSNMLAPGAFDGFPTGCCVEAGACGTAIFCTDDLGQNIAFQDGQDIVLVQADAQSITVRLRYYLTHYDELQAVGKRGSATIARVFNLTSQVEQRVAILQAQLSIG